MTTSGGNPISALREFVAQAADIGLHIILTRQVKGAERVMSYDPILQLMRDVSSPALIMSGTKDEGQFWAHGYSPRPLPPGRGMLFTRRHDWRMIQTAQLD